MKALPLSRSLFALILLVGVVHAPASANGSGLRLAERIDPTLTRYDASGTPPAAIALTLSDDIGESLLRELVLLTGEQMLGAHYVYGADRDDAVDCSSLVGRMFRSAGKKLPRTSRELVAIGEPVVNNDYAPGDLLFYRWGPSDLHVAVYLEDDRILHASSSQREVVISSLTPVWEQRMVAARRLL